MFRAVVVSFVTLLVMPGTAMQLVFALGAVTIMAVGTLKLAPYVWLASAACPMTPHDTRPLRIQ
jgi:hypothetical protein